MKQLEQASTLADQKEEALAASTLLQDERDALRLQTVEMQRRMDDLEAKIKQAAEEKLEAQRKAGEAAGSSGPRPSGGGEPCGDSAADAESLLVARRHEDDAAWLAYKQDVRAFEAHVEHLSLDALPEFTPGKAQLGVLGDLHHDLRCWMTEGASVPVTLLTMHTKVRKEAAAVLYKFLGDILPKFQLDLSDSSTVLPRQVMLLMFKAFDMSRDRYNKHEVARIKSQKVYAAMKAAQRKRPAEQTLKRVCDRQKDPDAKLAIAKK